MLTARRIALLVAVTALLSATSAFAQSSESSADDPQQNWFVGLSPTVGYSSISPEGPPAVIFNAAPLTVEARLNSQVGLRTSTLAMMRHSDALHTERLGFSHSVPLYFAPFSEGGGQLYMGPTFSGSYEFHRGPEWGLGGQVGWAAPLGESLKINVGLEALWRMHAPPSAQSGGPGVGVNLDLGWWLR